MRRWIRGEFVFISWNIFAYSFHLFYVDFRWNCNKKQYIIGKWNKNNIVWELVNVINVWHANASNLLSCNARKWSSIRFITAQEAAIFKTCHIFSMWSDEYPFMCLRTLICWKVNFTLIIFAIFKQPFQKVNFVLIALSMPCGKL